jgi:hypothetical protein
VPESAKFDKAAMAPYVRKALAQQMTQAAPQKKEGIGPWPYAALIGGNAADTLTTYQALKGGHGQEGNPLLPKSAAGIAAVKAGMTIPEILIMRAMTPNHPKLAKAAGYGLGAAGALLALHNHQVGKP